jgi:hypothetical protein
MGISMLSGDETSEHAMNLKVTIKAQKVSFARVQDLIKNLCLKGRESALR